MIKITKNSLPERIFIMVIICMVPYTAVMVALFFTIESWAGYTACLAVLALFFYLAQKVAFNDYEIWADASTKTILLKRRNEETRLPASDFLNFTLEDMGIYASHEFKYFRLSVAGKHYRIRFYIDKTHLAIRSVFGMFSEVQTIEKEIKEKIKWLMDADAMHKKDTVKFNAQQQFGSLIMCLRLLSADYHTQVAYFPDFVHIPDELALTFDNCFILLPQIIDAGLIKKEDTAEIKEIDAAFTFMANIEPEQHYTLEALENDFFWQNIRKLAKHALVKIGQEGPLEKDDNVMYLQQN